MKVALLLLVVSALANDPNSCADSSCEDDLSGLMQAPVKLKVVSGTKGQLGIAETVADPRETSETSVTQLKAGASRSQQPAVADPPPPPLALTAGLFGLVAVLGIAAGVQVMQDKLQLADLAPFVCEFIGTFLLVFTVGCASISGSGTWNATAIAAVLMVSIYAMGPICGGHFNPAVTLALFLSGKVDMRKVLGYVPTQLLAGVTAGCFYSTLLNRSVGLSIGDGFTWYDALIVEVIYTAMLCFVVLNTAASKRNNPATDPNQFFALAIGFVIIAGGYAVGGVSGACLNPAVSLGLDVSSLSDGAGAITVGWGFAYTAFQAVGAGVAALLFYLCRPEERLAEIPGDWAPDLVVKCLSEFLGTFILVFTVGMNLSTGSLSTAWSAAAALMCMIYSLGNVSGAHFNPAVTLAVVLSGREKCKPMEGLAYVGSQILAGLMAGFLFAHFHAAGPSKANQFFPADGTYTWHQIDAAEIMFTFVLAYVVLTVATTTATPQPTSFYFALAIGSCVTAGGLAVGGISGGELNPAVAIGIAASDAGYHEGDLALGTLMTNTIRLSIMELIGGALASGIFRVTHSKEYAAKI